MSGRLHALSLRAIRLAAACPSDQPADLFRFLYGYGRRPATLQLERDLGAGDDPMLVLDLASGGPTRQHLDPAYESSTHPGWYSFRRRGPPRDGLRAKLYASPVPEALPASFPRIAQVLSQHGVPSFKVGRGLSGLLRPDKIVAYFDDPEQVVEVGIAIAAVLADQQPQGVPFTRDLAGDGMVSWGVDPEPPEGAPPKSWRSLVCGHLAAAVLDARRAAVDPVDHALAYLQARGIEAWRATAI